MTSYSRRNPRAANFWPGFVDALASLLMVVIFVLLVFVLAQIFLSETLAGRDSALIRLQSKVERLADLLALEQRDNEGLRGSLSQLSAELQASLAERDELGSTLRLLTQRAETAERQSARLDRDMGQLAEQARIDQQTIAAKDESLARLANDIAALSALKAELESEITRLGSALDEQEGKLLAEQELSESARAQVSLLNQQLAALREQMRVLAKALDAAETLAEEQQVEIVSLGQRLNAALASKVQELANYRSEFFGRLREVLGQDSAVQIVGDRFVLPSEVLFAPGSAALGEQGRAQITELGQTINDLAARIPADIDWVLRVDGHTDKTPIATSYYRSNWELSAARALSVIRLLIEQGVPPERLAAAGFGEFHPLDSADTEEAYRRNRRIELKLTQR